MGTQIDVLDILRKFDLRPKTVKDDEFIAEVSFGKVPKSALYRDVEIKLGWFTDPGLILNKRQSN